MASPGRRDALKKQVARAEQKLRAALDRADTRLERYGQETEAKVRAPQEQARPAAGRLAVEPMRNSA